MHHTNAISLYYFYKKYKKIHKYRITMYSILDKPTMDFFTSKDGIIKYIGGGENMQRT